MLGWSVKRLVQASRVSAATITRFERGEESRDQASIAAIQRTLEAAGIEFLPDGVRLPPTPALALTDDEREALLRFLARRD